MHRLAPATPRPPCDATRFPNPTHPFHHTHTQASPASPAAAAVLQKLTAVGPGVLQLYRSPGLSASKAATLLKSIRPYVQNFHSSQLVGALARKVDVDMDALLARVLRILIDPREPTDGRPAGR